MEVKIPDETAKSALTKALYKLGFSSALDGETLANMADAFKLESYKSGEVIFKKDEIGKTFYIIYKGNVQVHGKKFGMLPSTLATFKPGDSFGEMALVQTIIRTATTKAQGETELFALHSNQFKTLFDKNPTFKANLQKLAQSRGLEITSKSGQGLL